MSGSQEDIVIKALVEAVYAEKEAIALLNQLTVLAPSHKEHNQLTIMKQEESRHLHQFTNAYYELTSHYPVVNDKGNCSILYRQGIQQLIEAKQNNVSFYLDGGDWLNEQDPILAQVFRRAAADEQQHAIWLVYFLTLLP